MIKEYRGHEISVNLEFDMSFNPIYYSVFRKSDGLECMSGSICVNCDEDVVTNKLIHIIDNQLELDEPWIAAKEVEKAFEKSFPAPHLRAPVSV